MFKRKELSTRSESESSSDDEGARKKVLVLAGRGISNRYRHLYNDLLLLIPHSKKDQKVDTRKDLRLLQEFAELASCQYIVLLESRNGQDYLWLSQRNQGPTIRLSISSFSTCEELGLAGNFLRNTSFIFNTSLRESSENDSFLNIFSTVFGIGIDSSTSDKIMNLYEHSGSIFLRTFQMSENAIEAGPRLSFEIDIIMKGCFTGELVYKRKLSAETQ